MNLRRADCQAPIAAVQHGGPHKEGTAMRDERQYGDAIRIRFRPEQLKALDLMAERVGNTRSGLVRHLVAKSIAEASK